MSDEVQKSKPRECDYPTAADCAGKFENERSRHVDVQRPKPIVVFVNGPPRSGKDTAGTIIGDLMHGRRVLDSNAPRCKVLKMAEPLKCGTHALFAALRGELLHEVTTDGGYVFEDAPAFDDAAYEPEKDKPSPDFFGATARACYIAVAEKLLKPTFGQSFFGKLLARRIASMSGVLVVTDSGFAIEAEPVRDAVGDGNCALVRMRRSGCSFVGDSRSYITLPGVRTVDIDNDGTTDDLRKLLERWLPFILGEDSSGDGM